MIGWIAFGITFIALLLSLWYNFKFARIIIKVEDSITESLDILDILERSMANLETRLMETRKCGLKSDDKNALLACVFR